MRDILNTQFQYIKIACSLECFIRSYIELHLIIKSPVLYFFFPCHYILYLVLFIIPWLHKRNILILPAIEFTASSVLCLTIAYYKYSLPFYVLPKGSHESISSYWLRVLHLLIIIFAYNTEFSVLYASLSS